MAEDRAAGRLAALSHALVHRDHLSPQAAWRVLRESYALRVTLSEVEDALEASQCPHCPDRASEPPPAAQEQPAAAVHSRPGGLTEMLAGDGG